MYLLGFVDCFAKKPYSISDVGYDIQVGQVMCATVPLAPHMLVEVLVQVLGFGSTHALKLALHTRPVRFHGIGR